MTTNGLRINSVNTSQILKAKIIKGKHLKAFTLKQEPRDTVTIITQHTRSS
jgi:hypothetical protein